MDKPYSTDGNGLAASLICAAMLEKLLDTGTFTRSDVIDLLRDARGVLGNGPFATTNQLNAVHLIGDLIDRYSAQSI
jgi:hypothetical protein